MIKPILSIGLFFVAIVSFAGSDKDVKFETRARQVHEKCLTIDTHCDTPMMLVKPGFDLGQTHTAPRSRVDFPRMKAGGLDAIFFAIYTSQKPRTIENYENTYKLANKMIDSVYSALNRNSELAVLALKSSDLARIEKTGKRAIYLGMENGFPLAKDISRVEGFYKKGIRYITLCHSLHNDICDSSSDKAPAEHNGVSDFGKQVIAEMNRLGMMVDVSHVSDKSFFDAVELSKAPVIASHSSVRSVAKHDRNMTDTMIKKLAAKGGVIQICLLDDYVRTPDTTSVKYVKMKELRAKYWPQWEKMTDEQKKIYYKELDDILEASRDEGPTVSDYCDHIDYVKKLVGVEYIGIGSDFDGGGGLRDCADVAQMPNITKELLRRGYSQSEIQKIWGGNLLRVFEQVEKTAEKLKTSSTR